MSSLDWVAQVPADLQKFVTTLQGRPDFPRNLARLSRRLRKAKTSLSEAAELLAEQARLMSPVDPVVREETEWFFARRVPRWHFLIVNDKTRNDVYREALQRHVKPGMVVLEIGTGTGLLAMLAARLGAGHVYTCESEPLMAEVARDNIARNGLADRITVIGKRSDRMKLGTDLAERADLLVSEIVDNDLLGENILASMTDAWARLLNPGAIVLPDQIGLRGAVVGGEAWSVGFRAPGYDGLDLSAVERLAPPRLPMPQSMRDNDFISDDVTVLHYDLSVPARSYRTGRGTFVARARRAGTADGFLHWLWLRFGPELEFTNRPPVESAWAPIIHAFPERVAVVAGDELAMAVSADADGVRIWHETAGGEGLKD